MQGEQAPPRFRSKVVVIALVAFAVLVTGSTAILIVEALALERQVKNLGELLQGSSSSLQPGPPWWYPTLPLHLEAAQLSAFLGDCEKSASGWKMGRVEYPKQLSLDRNQTGAYSVTLDIRNTSLPTQRLISSTDPESAPIAVQCSMVARLTSIDSSLAVDNAGWVLREFTPSGYVNWSWGTTALVTGSHALRLEVQPVVTTQISSNGTMVALAEADTSPNTTTFISRVEVHGSLIEDFNQKFSNDWPYILAIGAAVAGGILATIRALGAIGRAGYGLYRDWRGDQGEQTSE